MKAGIILARLDSTRFPQKALAYLGQKRLVEWAIEGVRRVPDVEPILATTDRRIDHALIEVAENNEIKYFQGSCEDVAKRVADAIETFGVEFWARVNGDSPFVQVDLLETGFLRLEQGGFDFVTNLLPRSFPYGISVEVFSSEIYLKEYQKFETAQHREHITSFFYENNARYNFYNIRSNEHVDPTIRLTVDTPEDLKLLNELVSRHHLSTGGIKWEVLIKEFQ